VPAWVFAFLRVLTFSSFILYAADKASTNFDIHKKNDVHIAIVSDNMRDFEKLFPSLSITHIFG